MGSSVYIDPQYDGIVMLSPDIVFFNDAQPRPDGRKIYHIFEQNEGLTLPDEMVEIIDKDDFELKRRQLISKASENSLQNIQQTLAKNGINIENWINVPKDCNSLVSVESPQTLLANSSYLKLNSFDPLNSNSNDSFESALSDDFDNAAVEDPDYPILKKSSVIGTNSPLDRRKSHRLKSDTKNSSLIETNFQIDKKKIHQLITLKEKSSIALANKLSKKRQSLRLKSDNKIKELVITEPLIKERKSQPKKRRKSGNKTEDHIEEEKSPEMMKELVKAELLVKERKSQPKKRRKSCDNTEDHIEEANSIETMKELVKTEPQIKDRKPQPKKVSAKNVRTRKAKTSNNLQEEAPLSINFKISTEFSLCVICKEIVKQNDFKSHLQEHFESETEISPKEQTVVNLVEIENNMQNAVDSVPVSLKCTLCNFMSNDKVLFSKHVESHSQKDISMCSLCQFSTTFPMDIQIHMNVHHKSTSNEDKDSPNDETPPSTNFHSCRQNGKEVFMCILCGYTSQGCNTLRIHVRRHFSETIHSCLECDFRTAHPSILTLHLNRIHFGDVVFECPKCDHLSISNSDMLQHVKTHNDVTPEEKTHICTDELFIQALLK